jgi:hypothetical protein
MAHDPAEVDDADLALHDTDDVEDDLLDEGAVVDNGADAGPTDDEVADFLGAMTEDEAGTTPTAAAGDAPEAGDATLPPEIAKKQKDLEAGYTRKFQALAEQRRELEERERMLAAREAAQEVAREQVAKPAAPTAPKLTLKDCVDEDGYMDFAKLEEYERQRDQAIEARIVEQHLKPVGDKLTEREKREQDAEMVATEKRLRRDFDMAKKAFPHFAGSENVQREVVEYMGAHRLQDFKAAYAALYPTHFAAAVQDFNARKARQNGGTAPAPVLPPGRHQGTHEALPSADDEEAFDEVVAREAARLMGVPVR